MKTKLIFCFIFCLFIQIGLLSGDEPSSIIHQCSQILELGTGDISIEKFSGGVGNRVYLLTTASGDQFVAKLFTKKSLDEVEEIESTVSKLQQLGFAIPKTVAITLLDDSTPLHIAKFQAGKHVSDERLEQVAKLMANLHIKGTCLSSGIKEKYKGDEHFKRLF